MLTGLAVRKDLSLKKFFWTLLEYRGGGLCQNLLALFYSIIVPRIGKFLPISFIFVCGSFFIIIIIITITIWIISASSFCHMSKTLFLTSQEKDQVTHLRARVVVLVIWAMPRRGILRRFRIVCCAVRRGSTSIQIHSDYLQSAALLCFSNAAPSLALFIGKLLLLLHCLISFTEYCNWILLLQLKIAKCKTIKCFNALPKTRFCLRYQLEHQISSFAPGEFRLCTRWCTTKLITQASRGIADSRNQSRKKYSDHWRVRLVPILDFLRRLHQPSPISWTGYFPHKMTRIRKAELTLRGAIPNQIRIFF